MRSSRLVIGLFAAQLACAFVTCTMQPSPTSAAAEDRGAALFARHCASCHGKTGNADTPVAELLRPRPAAFGTGVFKLASTQNGVPTHEDLVAMLRRGMPGSTMMSWGWLPEQDLEDLADEVMRLAIAGRAASIARTAAIGGQVLSDDRATTMAEQQLRPGATVDIGTPVPLTDGNLAAGEKLYLQHCANCHGRDGRGLPGTRDWQTDGTWLWPRDFTSGYLRGGASYQDLACRIGAGMPGSHMPPTALAPTETAALVAFVQGLIPEQARDHHVQWQRTIRVRKLAQLPGNDDGAPLTHLDTVRLPVAPLWWTPEAASEIWLRAAHDGETLLWQLEWQDATRDDRALPGQPMGDGAAVQFAATDDPPLFAMGTSSEPVNVWRWRAFDAKETAGAVDLLDDLHRRIDVPAGALQPHSRSESLQLGGSASASRATTNGLPLTAVTRWQDGRWTVTFRRSLRARSEREVDLGGTGPVRFALAIWDGTIDHHAGSKAITTWHVLELQQ